MVYLSVLQYNMVIARNVWSRTSMTSVEATIIHYRHCWAGHIHKMDPLRLPKEMFYGELTNGTRLWGAPKVNYYSHQYQPILVGTNKQPETIQPGGEPLIEALWILRRENEEERLGRKEQCEQPHFLLTLPCQHCSRLFHHRLGLASHAKQKHW